MGSVLHRLSRWAETDPQAVAQRFKKADVWVNITAKEYCDRVFHFALYLESKGMTAKDVGCIYSPNCPQWVHLDLAVLLLGSKSAGIYPNSTAKDIRYVLQHTEAKVLSVQGKDAYQKIIADGTAIPSSVSLIISFDNDTSFSPLAVSYEEALQEGRKIAASASQKTKTISDYLSRLDPKAPAFLIYTSGTTGNPKAAQLSHDNLVFTSDAICKFWLLPYGKGMMFSFLPLCHVAEKLQTVGCGISQRYTVSYATKFDAVSFELPQVQPTLLLCVPRLWEKMMEGVTHKLKNAPPTKKKLTEWAMELGGRISAAKYSGKTPGPLDLAQHLIADRLVLSKIRHALGLAKAVALGSGAAALPSHVTQWFRGLNLEIMEDYGQTESTGVICLTEPGVESSGTVGRPLPGTEFKIAADGEMLTRGRHVFLGYYKDDAATKAAFDEEGWLKTGDLAEINERGLVRIKGRKKEILKTSGGKMVAPLPIEEELKASPIINQVCMVGDGRKYLAALITLSETKMKEVGEFKVKTITDAKVIAEVKKYIDELNAHLPSYEQIKRFVILSKDFSIEEGEMTATLKMKRNVIEQRYADVIEQLYTG
jgi:long-chain acyl-CoA synthetase